VCAVVSGAVTEAGLRALLGRLHGEVEAKRQARGDRRPRAVGVYLYTDRERLEDGARCVAMLLASPGGPVKVDVDRDQLARLGAAPEDRFGLSERLRREAVRAEN
jgi:hypothetical protein